MATAEEVEPSKDETMSPSVDVNTDSNEEDQEPASPVEEVQEQTASMEAPSSSGTSVEASATTAAAGPSEAADRIIEVHPSSAVYPSSLLSLLLSLDYDDDNSLRQAYPSLSVRTQDKSQVSNEDQKLAATNTSTKTGPLNIPKHILGYSTNFIFVHQKLLQYSMMDDAGKERERSKWHHELAEWEKQVYANQAREIMNQRQLLLSLPPRDSPGSSGVFTSKPMSGPFALVKTAVRVDERREASSSESVAQLQLSQDQGVTTTTKSRKRSRHQVEQLVLLRPPKAKKQRRSHHSPRRFGRILLRRNVNIPPLPASVWVDHIMSFISDRESWNNISRACQDIHRQSKLGYNRGETPGTQPVAAASAAGPTAADSGIVASRIQPNDGSQSRNHQEQRYQNLPPPWPKTVLGPSSNIGGCVTFSFTGRFLAYPMPTGDVQVYDRYQGKCVTLHQADEASNQPSIIMSSLSSSTMPSSLSSCCFSPVEDVLACTYRRLIFLWDLSSLADDRANCSNSTTPCEGENTRVSKDDASGTASAADSSTSSNESSGTGVPTYHVLCRKHTNDSKSVALNGKKRQRNGEDEFVMLKYRVLQDAAEIANQPNNHQFATNANRRARPTCLTFSPDGLVITCIFRDNARGGNNLNDALHLHSTIHFYDTNEGTIIRRLRLPGTIGPIKYSPNGQTLAAGSSFMSRAVRGHGPPGARIYIIEENTNDQNAARAVDADNDEGDDADANGDADADENAAAEGAEEAAESSSSNASRSARTLSSLLRLYAPSTNNGVVRHDQQDNPAISIRCLGTAGRTLTDVAYSHDGKWLASSYSDGCIKVTSVIEKNYRKSKKFRLRRRNRNDMIMPSSITSIAFSPNDSNYLVCGYADGTIYARNAHERRLVELHSESFRVPIDCLSFSPDGRTIASVPRGGLVRLFAPL